MGPYADLQKRALVMAVHEAATMELHFGQRAHRLPTTKEVANHFTEGIDCETVTDRSGLEFPLEQCHYGAGIEFTITSTPKDLYFVGQVGLGIDDEPINPLPACLQMLRMERILRIGREDRPLFVFRVDDHDIRRAQRRNESECEKQKC